MDTWIGAGRCMLCVLLGVSMRERVRITWHAAGRCMSCVLLALSLWERVRVEVELVCLTRHLHLHLHQHLNLLLLLLDDGIEVHLGNVRLRSWSWSGSAVGEAIVGSGSAVGEAIVGSGNILLRKASGRWNVLLRKASGRWIDSAHVPWHAVLIIFRIHRGNRGAVALALRTTLLQFLLPKHFALRMELTTEVTQPRIGSKPRLIFCLHLLREWCGLDELGVEPHELLFHLSILAEAAIGFVKCGLADVGLLD